MKNANKRLLISIAALVIAIALAATTTFAWFTMDTTPEVNDIDLSVTVQDGLYISENGDLGSFRTSVNVTNDSTTVLKAITPESAGSTTFKALADGSYTETRTVADTDYYKHKFTIRSHSEYKLYIQDITMTLKTDEDDTYIERPIIEAWTDIPVGVMGNTAVITKGTAIPLANLMNVIRVGFVFDDLDEDTEATAMSVYKGPRVDNSEGDPSLGKLVDTYNEGKAENSKYNAAYDHFVTMYENENSNWSAFETAWKNPAAGTTYMALATGGDFEDATSIGTLKKVGTDVKGTDDIWYIADVTVYIWAEGTDNDCFNEILADSVKINITFAGEYIPLT